MQIEFCFIYAQIGQVSTCRGVRDNKELLLSSNSDTYSGPLEGKKEHELLIFPSHQFIWR